MGRLAFRPIKVYQGRGHPRTCCRHCRRIRAEPFQSIFNPSDTYSSHVIRFSLSGLPKNTDLIMLLDGVGWAPRPDVGIDRWHYNILRGAALCAGIHNLTFLLGSNVTEGLAQLCGFEIIECGNSTE